MNKLAGFYELDRAGLPSVPWKKYDGNVSFSQDNLWTIRSAVLLGDDLNLPRKVGVDSKEAKAFAEHLMQELNENDLVLYYPYFIAEKSGVMEVSSHRFVIEAVKADLWNLVTHNEKEVTIVFTGENTSYIGNQNFLEEKELSELLQYARRIKMKFRDLLSEGKSVFLEWSYAYMSDIHKTPIGDKKLVFYEIRSVM